MSTRCIFFTLSFLYIHFISLTIVFSYFKFPQDGVIFKMKNVVLFEWKRLYLAVYVWVIMGKDKTIVTYTITSMPSMGPTPFLEFVEHCLPNLAHTHHVNAKWGDFDWPPIESLISVYSAISQTTDKPIAISLFVNDFAIFYFKLIVLQSSAPKKWFGGDGC